MVIITGTITEIPRTKWYREHSDLTQSRGPTVCNLKILTGGAEIKPIHGHLIYNATVCSRYPEISRSQNFSQAWVEAR